ncbi:MAG TPA: DNA-processing protein DprA, partial [Candidatus Limnocylindria bacterium]|nr:DNA-processing protein DprA [Candidatus Limnocylindria bacterium]
MSRSTAQLHGAPEDRPYWIALSLVPGVGPVGFRRIVDRYGSARAAWEAGGAILDYLPRTVPEASFGLRRLSKEGPAAAAERVEEATRRAGGVVLTALDRAYPATLANLEPHPPVLYVRGDVGALEQTCVAIVGTRRPTGYGRATTAELTDELARASVTIVSGLAIGIDGEAHRAAIRAGGRSVAVLPSPLTRIYPPVHRALAAQLVESDGALITEVPPGGPTGRPDFARRNRIIAGLSQAVVVVEAPDRSGALLTAAAAIAYERELYAVPGPIDALASRGCNRLIADQQATIVTSVASLLQRVGATSGAHSPVAVASLSESEALVLAVLLERSASIEELMARTRLETPALASTLTLLEARGL